MDNVTHSLVGLMMARVSKQNAWMMVVAANLPDMDVVSWLGGTATYLQYHRGLTHALIAAPVLALVLTLAFGRRNWASYAWCLAGVLSHLVLDWTNVYGIRLLLPFSSKWLHLDMTDVVDPWILLALLLAVAAPALSGLVGAEIGAKGNTGAKKGWAYAALVFLLMYEGGRVFAHERALSMLSARTWNGRLAQNVHAFPNRWSPFAWRGVVQGDAYVVGADINLPAEMEEGWVDYGGEPNEAALKTRPFQVFANFNQLPFWQKEKRPDGSTEVRLLDLRFGTPEAPGFAATAVVAEGAVKESRVGFGRVLPGDARQ
jgi:inner membrane protein